MKKVTLLLVTLLAANMAIADGHGHDNEFPFKYFLHNDLTTENAQATLAGTRAFVETGVMSDRGVAVGLYAYNAAGAHPASHMTMFAYPSADALPGADLFQGSDAHMQYQSAMQGAGNQTVHSVLYKSVKEILPGDAGGKFKVFVNYYLSVSDPETYAATWLKLMKDVGVSDAYGIRQVVAGDSEGVTHYLWIGFESMADLARGMDSLYTSDETAAAMETFAGIRQIKRTAILTSAYESITDTIEQ
jgi:hypothetical protein